MMVHVYVLRWGGFLSSGPQDSVLEENIRNSSDILTFIIWEELGCPQIDISTLIEFLC